jgi:L-ascorbate metabolism protein UlaG (beta-lactamase superfamily)
VRIGPWRLYHAGDTIRYHGMAERLRPHAPHLALLPINGRAPERGVAGNLDGAEAALLARDMGAGLAVPCHFEMFAFNTAPPDAFAAECARLGQPYRVMRAGERLSLRPARAAGT